MSIPEFTPKGTLPAGIHLCSGNEFVERFVGNDVRRQYAKPVYDILDFAKDRCATHVFVGGSFVTDRDTPGDFDCLIIFSSDREIPSKNERISVSGIAFDILYASRGDKFIIDTFLKLFSSGRMSDEPVGIIQIDLYHEGHVWEIHHQPSEDEFEIIKRVYNDRSLIDFNKGYGTLVSIHGLLSRAQWNQLLAPTVSSQGWVFAPFIYETNKPDLLLNKNKRDDVIENFRNWIYEVKEKFGSDISIVAHSFGTYIITEYLKAFDLEEFSPVTFNSIVLTGSIVRRDFDWNKYKGKNVGAVYNMVAPNDQWIKFMPEGFLSKFLGMKDEFGRSGLEGFDCTCDILSQSKNEIFTHNNTFRADVIEKKWMPFLNINRSSFHQESMKLLKSKWKQER